MYAWDERHTTLSISDTDLKLMAKVPEKKSVVKKVDTIKNPDGSIAWVDVVFEHSTSDHKVAKIK